MFDNFNGAGLAVIAGVVLVAYWTTRGLREWIARRTPSEIDTERIDETYFTE